MNNTNPLYLIETKTETIRKALINTLDRAGKIGGRQNGHVTHILAHPNLQKASREELKSVMKKTQDFRRSWKKALGKMSPSDKKVKLSHNGGVIVNSGGKKISARDVK